MARPFVPGEDQLKAIEQFRRQLRETASSSIHIRVCGEPGIGKTRLVLEATRAPDIGATVLYAEHPSLLTTDAIAQIEAVVDTCDLTLIVDECDPEERSMLRRRFKGRGANINVISIYMDEDESDRSGDYLFFQAPALPENQIVEIFRQVRCHRFKPSTLGKGMRGISSRCPRCRSKLTRSSTRTAEGGWTGQGLAPVSCWKRTLQRHRISTATSSNFITRTVQTLRILGREPQST